MERTNHEGLTFTEWCNATTIPVSRRSRSAWKRGEDPTDHRAGYTPPPVVVETYCPPPNVAISNPKVGQFVRDMCGTYHLWRIINLFGSSSPYIQAIRVTESKNAKPGDKIDLLPIKDYKLEPSPTGFLKSYGLKANLDVSVKLR